MTPTINTLPDFREESLRGAPGYFRVGRTHAGQWWLIDGPGRPFFAKVVHRVSVEEDTEYDPAPRLRSWGFNGLGCESDALALDEGLPFLATVDFCTMGEMIQSGGVRLPDVFAKAWPIYARDRAEEVCGPWAENRELLGWVSDDGPSWPSRSGEKRPGLLQVCLSLDPDKAAYHAAWEFVLALYGGDLRAMAAAWRVELSNKEALRTRTREERGIVTEQYRRDDERWSREFARRYFTETAKAIRAADGNHLVFGVRWRGAVPAGLRRECAAAVDVSLVDFTELDEVGSGAVMLGDFCWARRWYFRESSSREVLGPTKLERMLRRGRLALTRAVSHPAVVGYAWSRWRDRKGEEPPFGTGLVRRNDSVAVEHTELLSAINERVEALRAVAVAEEEAL